MHVGARLGHCKNILGEEHNFKGIPCKTKKTLKFLTILNLSQFNCENP